MTKLDVMRPEIYSFEYLIESAKICSSPLIMIAFLVFFAQYLSFMRTDLVTICVSYIGGFCVDFHMPFLFICIHAIDFDFSELI